MSYALVTPARDEAENLRRLGQSLAAQTLAPTAWIVVDNGSTDDTAAVVEELAAAEPWVRSCSAPPADRARPGTPVVRAFHAGLRELDAEVEVVVKLDADVTLPPGYMERVVAEFRRRPRLGIAGGDCLEHDGRRWRAVAVTGGHVRGAVRAYRRACLDELLPLEERMGWDTIDELTAQARGWETETIDGLEFFHHRKLGARDGAPDRRWRAQGEGAYYMGYRFSYLLLRALRHARRDRAALAMVTAYVRSLATHAPRLDDADVRARVRRDQRLRALPARFRESRG